MNRDVAERLDEVAQVLTEQRANPYRVRAYRRAAQTVRTLSVPIDELLHEGGAASLEALPGIGENLARSIATLVTLGSLPMLERLRGGLDPVEVLSTVPGIGRRTAERLHHDLGIDTLEDLEAAATDGRLGAQAGLGPKRLTAIRDSLAMRLGRVRGAGSRTAPAPVGELLDVDAEYRAGAAAGTLRTIAPRRFNPSGEAWLPILHTERDGRHYTVLYSNSPRAHRLGTTHDWVVVHVDQQGGEDQWTIVTARWGPMEGRRIVRGREDECAAFYANPTASTDRERDG